MALKNVIGIDHAVVMVKDLDKAAENYKQLGFTVSPRGTHSAHMDRATTPSCSTPTIWNCSAC